MINQIKKDLANSADEKKAILLQRYFKTGPGEYAEGDVFLGVTVPQTRKIVRQYREMPLSQVRQLLKSPIHEHRQAALFILVWQFESRPEGRGKIYKLYLAHTKYINNWDLVDSSAPQIVGGYLLSQADRSILDTLATSGDLWKQRIAMLATSSFIKQNDFSDALRMAELLLAHPHDLIHKAVGWMLREIGNRDLTVEEAFLRKHYKTMPRTALRYALEKFSPERRRQYLQRKV